MDHPFKKRQVVKCIKAARDSDLEVGGIYIIESTFFGNQDPKTECIKGMENVPGVTVIGASGYFTADRFVIENLKL